MALTQKQKKFVNAYLRLGGEAAAYRAAYDVKNMSDKSIHREAHRMLSHPKIAPLVAAANEHALQGAIHDRQRTLKEFAKAAYGEPTDELTWAMKIKAADCLAKIDGLYEKDNSQRMPNLAIQVNLVGPEQKPVVDAKRLP